MLNPQLDPETSSGPWGSSVHSQAATYCFVLAASGITSIGHCLRMVLGHEALQRHGIAQTLHSTLQASIPQILGTSKLVHSRAHLKPETILSYLWLLYLQNLAPGNAPATEVHTA